mmetsp:Transcript_15516/g.33109  ORF Transcript_15516/g.33109 Transcript_15516/m.33109 type:complete len:277 (-) Transcript_15516:337-1167(-)
MRGALSHLVPVALDLEGLALADRGPGCRLALRQLLRMQFVRAHHKRLGAGIGVGISVIILIAAILCIIHIIKVEVVLEQIGHALIVSAGGFRGFTPRTVFVRVLARGTASTCDSAAAVRRRGVIPRDQIRLRLRDAVQERGFSYCNNVAADAAVAATDIKGAGGAATNSILCGLLARCKRGAQRWQRREGGVDGGSRLRLHARECRVQRQQRLLRQRERWEAAQHKREQLVLGHHLSLARETARLFSSVEKVLHDAHARLVDQVLRFGGCAQITQD